MCHHLVAFAHLGHTGADSCDRPGHLRPERHRCRAADPPVADPDKLVPVADAGGCDVDEDLLGGRRRKLVHLKDLDWLAECCDPSRSHPARSWYWPYVGVIMTQQLDIVRPGEH